jgi:sulfur carrier protein
MACVVPGWNMKIVLNGATCEITATRLDQALIELGYTDASIATAINGMFVPKSQRPKKVLDDGDRVEIVAPMQGG